MNITFRAGTLEELTKFEGWRPTICEDTKSIIAEDDGVFCAAVAFDHWTKNSCFVHIKIERPMVLKHGFLEEFFSFVFNNGRTKLIACVASDNEKVIKFMTHLGFEELFRIKDGVEIGIDYVFAEMRKENCRYYG